MFRIGSLSSMATRRFYGSVSKQMLKEFEEAVGSHAVATSEAKRKQHGHDESYHTNRPPAVVVFPEKVEQVSKIVRTCAANKVPVIPFGTGTGLEAGVCAVVPESVSIDLSLMKQVYEPNVDDFDVVVEAGVTRLELNRILKSTGLYFPIDPGADASLCGMCATGASGTMAVRYGTMRQNVLNLQVVLPDGRIVDTAGKGKRARKSSAGYNLTQLFIGSEGTLGVITKATLKLHPVPQHVAFSAAQFPSHGAAIMAAVDVMKHAIPVARIEFVDDLAVRASNSYSKLNQTEANMLMFEVHASSEALSEEQTALINEICQVNGATNMAAGSDVDERNKLWKARHDALYAAQALRPGSKCFVTDVCVPISQLPAVLDDAKKGLAELKLVGTIIGHVGDGNFHVLIPIVDNEKEVPVVKTYAERLGMRAIHAGGTCTGEHGIGLGKRRLLVEELGPDGIDLMKSIKSAIDPNNIMNPGKVIEH